MNRSLLRPAAFAAAVALFPGAALACACGCGVFDVGDGTFMPNNANSGFSAWFRYSFMDQDENWEGASKAPASDNADQKLETSFYTFGGQYVINRDWTVMAQLPIYDRSFVSTDDGSVAGPAGSLYHAHLTSLGDMELMATYTGFDKDLSTGLSLGVKLPTGKWKSPLGPLGGEAFDRDSMPGTGSTDLMIGGYHVGSLNKSSTLSWFAQARYQVAIATQEDYRPGDELDAALGVSYDLGRHGPFSSIAPVLQAVDSLRLRDSGANADPLNTGYERVLIEPGIAARVGKARLFADVDFPIYQHMNSAPNPTVSGTAGQLVARTMFRLQVSYDF
jgi:hypothetical protein